MKIFKCIKLVPNTSCLRDAEGRRRLEVLGTSLQMYNLFAFIEPPLPILLNLPCGYVSNNMNFLKVSGQNNYRKLIRSKQLIFFLFGCNIRLVIIENFI